MKRLLLSVVVALLSTRVWAIYRPSLTRTDAATAIGACEEAKFSHAPELIKAIQSQKTDDIFQILSEVLKEWQVTPVESPLYPARAFCVHEIVPGRITAREKLRSSHALGPSTTVVRFGAMRIEYYFYDPDGEWVLKQNPVDLVQLATNYQRSHWGREAFLMMTRLGWSQGACHEGPAQFRQVIKHGEEFLHRYPNSEVSSAVRLELAKAYATWWNLSREEPNDHFKPESYIQGAEQARQRAIQDYREYLKKPNGPTQKIEDHVKALIEDPGGSDTFDYFCEDYED